MYNCQGGKREPWFFVLILDNILWERKEFAPFTALITVEYFDIYSNLTYRQSGILKGFSNEFPNSQFRNGRPRFTKNWLKLFIKLYANKNISSLKLQMNKAVNGTKSFHSHNVLSIMRTKNYDSCLPPCKWNIFEIIVWGSFDLVWHVFRVVFQSWYFELPTIQV